MSRAATRSATKVESVSNRDDLLAVLSGRRPERIPFIANGFHDEKTMHKLAPADCWDENTYYVPSDEPQRERYSPEPRTRDSRERAVRMARHMDMCTLGVGKGGVFPFGHGGPGEIQPVVIERNPEFKILEYEGGSRRKIHYNPHSIHYYHFLLKEKRDPDSIELPDMRDPRRFQDVEEDCRLFKAGDTVTTGSIQGFFSGIHNSFMDFEDTMVNLLLEPEYMHRVTRVLAEMSLDAVDMYMDRGVEIIDVCDDLGNAAGLLLSPELFRTFFLPWYERLVDRVHQRGGYVHLHSHGNIAPVLPDFVSIGVDIINPFDWGENPDLPGLVRRFARDVVFCGGCESALYRFPDEEVEAIIRRACGLAEPAEGRYVLMVSGIIDALSIERWNRWRETIRRAREELAV